MSDKTSDSRLITFILIVFGGGLLMSSLLFDNLLARVEALESQIESCKIDDEAC